VSRTSQERQQLADMFKAVVAVQAFAKELLTMHRRFVEIAKDRLTPAECQEMERATHRCTEILSRLSEDLGRMN
jgi:hypothetical protein